MKTFKIWLVPLISFVLVTSFAVKDTVIILAHTGYTSHYNTDLKYPVKVEWWDTRARLGCTTKFPRKDNFAPDPLLPAETELLDDYV